MPPIDQSVTLATADENGVATFFKNRLCRISPGTNYNWETGNSL